MGNDLTLMTLLMYASLYSQPFIEVKFYRVVDTCIRGRGSGGCGLRMYVCWLDGPDVFSRYDGLMRELDSEERRKSD